MKTINTSPISGTQELLPGEQSVFNSLKSKIRHSFTSHGFLEIETPILQRSEVLFAKAGGDTEKQIYKVIKTAETADDSSEALRFDHTVPLARYVVEHESNLVFPFKVCQVGQNFRGERAQKGRFREFYQCDADIIGRGSLPVAYDADVIATMIDAYKSFGLNTPVLARISNRKILSGLLEALNLQAKSSDIYSIIDHSEKVPPEKTKQGFEEIGLNDETVAKLLDFIDIHGDLATVSKKLQNLSISHPLFKSGVAEISEVMNLLNAVGLEDSILADMRIVRGLDYYTGTVFEFILPEHKSVGSVGGGGRYENLTGYFSDQSFPGVGGSIGLNRLFYVINEHNLLESQSENLLDYAIVPVSSTEQAYALKLADKLREDGRSVTVVLTDKKLGDKLTYAAKLATNGIVIGETEAKSGKLQVKDFTTGESKDLNISL